MKGFDDWDMANEGTGKAQIRGLGKESSQFPISPAQSPVSNRQFPIANYLLNRGYEYLDAVQHLALEPGMVDVEEQWRDRVCTWIGDRIDVVNAKLNADLQACHDCFHPQERRQMQILATPLAGNYGIDGLCNIRVNPIVILIDVGRIPPDDWLSVVVHEYAHAHLAAPGHDQHFLKVISHLCLGLGLNWHLPLWEPGMDVLLRNWPHCDATTDPLAFWRGDGSIFR
jgi:hypothetical protein